MCEKLSLCAKDGATERDDDGVEWRELSECGKNVAQAQNYRTSRSSDKGPTILKYFILRPDLLLVQLK